jgi:hypothetical protein
LETPHIDQVRRQRGIVQARDTATPVELVVATGVVQVGLVAASKMYAEPPLGSGVMSLGAPTTTVLPEMATEKPNW